MVSSLGGRRCDEARDLRSAIHGGDIAAVGDNVSLNWFEGALGEKQEVKVRARRGP